MIHASLSPPPCRAHRPPARLSMIVALVGALTLPLPGLASAQSSAEEVESELEALEAELESSPPPEPTDEGSSDEGVDDELERLESELSGEDGASTSQQDTAKPPARRAEVPGAGVLATMNPDISLIADFALAWFSQEPSLLGGHDATQTGFNLQGLELGLAAGIDPYWRFDSHILLSLYGLEVEEAYATTLALPWGLQARAGQFLTNFGRINPTHLHAWNFTTQPLVIGKFFGGEGLRGLGAEVGGLLPLPWLASWTLSAQNIAGGATGRSFLASDSDITSLTDLSVAFRLEQFWDIGQRGGLLLGLNAVNGPNSSGRGNRTDIYGVDLLLKRTTTGSQGRSELGWQSEVMVRRRQDPGALDAPTGTVLQDWGGYTDLYYSPNLHWSFATRYERVHGVANDPLDPTWEDPRQRASVSLSYLPTHFSRLRLEYGLDHQPEGASPLTHMVFLQLDLVAGAHGAHAY
ncbi:zinc-regulated TonB-dependent outer membrane receptor [Lujinxingia vulgaris]|uniref:Zinc-regulated TonB-dependent outer membrane receptor n=1 Tax=Lujinxingia vulgaris TaxID=2600176 RepID=A0A5C6XIJ3_9DELT|nr:zinc-regulated TonB-dependent outer membrane receptor [Lujinxingia vulgaris]TXD39338.1 zinc-regulated TonB-dependent outer membrane receptor [Lujinxingia vulgaris]